MTQHCKSVGFWAARTQNSYLTQFSTELSDLKTRLELHICMFYLCLGISSWVSPWLGIKVPLLVQLNHLLSIIQWLRHPPSSFCFHLWFKTKHIEFWWFESWDHVNWRSGCRDMNEWVQVAGKHHSTHSWRPNSSHLGFIGTTSWRGFQELSFKYLMKKFGSVDP